MPPLKLAAQNGAWMNNYAGYSHYCFTPLATYITDTPKAAALTGVAGTGGRGGVTQGVNWESIESF